MGASPDFLTQKLIFDVIIPFLCLGVVAHRNSTIVLKLCRSTLGSYKVWRGKSRETATTLAGGGRWSDPSSRDEQFQKLKITSIAPNVNVKDVTNFHASIGNNVWDSLACKNMITSTGLTGASPRNFSSESPIFVDIEASMKFLS